MRVVAGVLRAADRRILVSQRPAGKHLAGAWEFPGGKVEHGESRFAALVREFDEELGIRVEDARPLITIPHAYPDRPVVLDVWEILASSGAAHAREGQALAWVTPSELANLAMPPADLPVLMALRLPSRYVITPPTATSADVLRGIRLALANGDRLFQLRLPHMQAQEIERLAYKVLAVCQPFAASVLINSDHELAMRTGLAGVHLPVRVAAGMHARPVAANCLLGVSCHDADELTQAVRIGADFATLSPIAATPGHADAKLLGWSGFEILANTCPLPIYALGGVGKMDIPHARRHGAQGIAAIRGLWPTVSSIS